MPRYPFYHWVRTAQDQTHPKAPLPIARKINLASWINQTKVSEKKYEAINNHAYKRSEKTQIIFIDITTGIRIFAVS